MYDITSFKTYNVSHSLLKPNRLAGWRTAAPCRNNWVHYRHTPFHFSHNERTPVQISLQYLHWC